MPYIVIIIKIRKNSLDFRMKVPAICLRASQYIVYDDVTYFMIKLFRGYL